MWKWLKAPFAWKDDHQAGAFLYQQNGVTGERRALQIFTGHSPIDREFIGPQDLIYRIGQKPYRTADKWGGSHLGPGASAGE